MLAFAAWEPQCEQHVHSVNPFQQKHKHLFKISIIPPHCYCTGCWNPFSWKTRTCHLHNQYHGFWCPGNARSQSINNHDFDYVETNWLGHHTLKVQLFLFAFFIQPPTVTCPMDQFYIVKKLNAYLNINISFSVIHLQPVLAYELMKYQKGVKHGRQQTKWSSPAFSHEISRMHGKLCSSPIKLLWVCHFHPSLNNTWLQTFT